MKKTKLIKEVRNCTNYNLFETLPKFNRKITASGIRKLKPSLLEYGFTDYVKVIKTNAFGKKNQLVIADAQHRLKACEELGIPFHYQIYEMLEDTKFAVGQFISVLNNTATKWVNQKKLESFSEAGVKEYLIIGKAMKETKLTFTDLFSIYLLKYGTTEQYAFGNGTIKFPDIKRSEKLLDAIMKLKGLFPKYSYVRRSLFSTFAKIETEHLDRFVKTILEAVDYTKAQGRLLPQDEPSLKQWIKTIYDIEFKKDCELETVA